MEIEVQRRMGLVFLLISRLHWYPGKVGRDVSPSTEEMSEETLKGITEWRDVNEERCVSLEEISVIFTTGSKHIVNDHVF